MGQPDQPLAMMTPRQRHVFDQVLAIGAERPYAPVGLVEELQHSLTSALTPVLARWTEPSLWVSKSTLGAISRCEAGFLHSRTHPRPDQINPQGLIGDLTHRAIQLAYTHPGRPVRDYVAEALDGLRTTDPQIAGQWEGLAMATQSDVLVSASSRVTGFLDSWPAIQPTWEPRFEEQLQAKVGRVTLSARVDLVLGRPRPSGQQSMVLCDWKSGGLREEQHEVEARYHALVATMSNEVPPFRSLVYSLASGQWTDPDVTAGTLRTAAEEVVAGVTAMVDLLTGRRQPQVRCEQPWCAGCTEASNSSSAAA